MENLETYMIIYIIVGFFLCLIMFSKFAEIARDKYDPHYKHNLKFTKVFSVINPLGWILWVLLGNIWTVGILTITFIVLFAQWGLTFTVKQ